MKQEIKELWVKALRSGEYKQTRKRLRRDDDTCCCLGVLCDLHLIETGEGVWEAQGEGPWTYRMVGGGESSAFTPGGVEKWAGLNVDHAAGNLMDLNDRQKKSFAVIADYIEKEL